MSSNKKKKRKSDYAGTTYNYVANESEEQTDDD